MEKILIGMLQSESMVAVILSLLLFYIVWSESQRKKREQILTREHHEEKIAQLEYRNEIKGMLRELNFKYESENGQIKRLSENFATFEIQQNQIKSWVHDLKNFEMKEKGYKELFEKRLEEQKSRLNNHSDVIAWHAHRLVHLEGNLLNESLYNKIPEFKDRTH